MLYNILFFLNYLLMSQKSVPLQCVFHSIRFKVNKGWSTAVLLFFALNFPFFVLYCFGKGVFNNQTLRNAS